jgi:hypothetical protein
VGERRYKGEIQGRRKTINKGVFHPRNQNERKKKTHGDMHSGRALLIVV